MRKKKKGSKKIWILLIIFLVVGGVIAQKLFFKQKTDTAVSTLVVTKEVRENIIETSGYIQPARSQKLQISGDGQINKIWVKEGDRVKKGEPLFSLDSTEQRYNLENHDFAIQREKISGASVRIKLMEKQRELLVKRLAERTVRARFDGILVAFDAQVGQYVTSRSEIGVLIDRGFLQATVAVSEFEAPRLKVGLPVEFSFSALPDIKLRGKVISYPAIAQVGSSGGAAVQTKIRIESPPDEVLPGYSFNAKIIAGSNKELLLIPKEAVRYESGQPMVDRLDGEKFEAVAVTIEPQGQRMFHVISGLSEGDTLKNQRNIMSMGMEVMDD